MVRIKIEDAENAEARNIKEKGFRLNCKQFFLTYPRCDMSKEWLLNKVKGIHEIEHYIISSEEHEEVDDEGCEGKHLHAYFKFVKKLNIKDEKHFDFDGYHPNIQSPKKPVAVQQYVKKEGDYIENKYFDDSDWNNWRTRKGDFDEWSMYRFKKELKEWEGEIKIFGETLDAGAKCRHLCLITDPDFGKSEEINRVFEGFKVFNASQGKYIMEGYDGERVIIFDCVMPPWAVIESCSTVWRIPTSVPGEQRYKKYYWPLKQERIMILLLNVYPEYPKGPFEARFKIVDKRKVKVNIREGKMGIPRPRGFGAARSEDHDEAG